MRKDYVVAAIAAGFWATTALAEQPPVDKGKEQVLNEKVCEDIKVVGSRLAKKRICGTRAEWEDRRRQDRDAVDKIQTQLCVVNPATGKC